MKPILSACMVFMLLVANTAAIPGGSYTLKGDETGLEEIVKADMERHPDLYKGVSFKFYMVKFKKLNDIGKRTLQPGEKLYFPETKASIQARHEKLRTALIGTWETENVSSDELSIVSIVEYLDNGKFTGTRTITFGKEDEPGSRTFKEKFSGKWKLKDSVLETRITESRIKLFKLAEDEEVEIVEISDEEMILKLENGRTKKATRIR